MRSKGGECSLGKCANKIDDGPEADKLCNSDGREVREYLRVRSLLEFTDLGEPATGTVTGEDSTELLQPQLIGVDSRWRND